MKGEESILIDWSYLTVTLVFFSTEDLGGETTLMSSVGIGCTSSLCFSTISLNISDSILLIFSFTPEIKLRSLKSQSNDVH